MLRNAYSLSLPVYGDLRAARQFGCLRAVDPNYETTDGSAFRSFGRMCLGTFAWGDLRLSGWSKDSRLSLLPRRYNPRRMRASAFLLQLSLGAFYDICRGRGNVRKQKDRRIPLLHGFTFGTDLRRAYASEREKGASSKRFCVGFGPKRHFFHIRIIGSFRRLFRDIRVRFRDLFHLHRRHFFVNSRGRSALTSARADLFLFRAYLRMRRVRINKRTKAFRHPCRRGGRMVGTFGVFTDIFTDTHGGRRAFACSLRQSKGTLRSLLRIIGSYSYTFLSLAHERNKHR